MSTVKKSTNKLGVFSTISILLGIISLVVKHFNPGYVTSSGVLEEPLFFLMPVGFLLIFIGIFCLIILLLKRTGKNKG